MTESPAPINSAELGPANLLERGMPSRRIAELAFLAVNSDLITKQTGMTMAEAESLINESSAPPPNGDTLISSTKETGQGILNYHEEKLARLEKSDTDIRESLGLPPQQERGMPCPFCGGVEISHSQGDERSFVMCNNCGAVADSLDTLPERTPMEVWNTRANGCFVIGDYKISCAGEWVWIENGGGEGMGVLPARFEVLIADFFNKEF